MAAVTNTTVFVNTAVAGVSVGVKSSSLTTAGILAPLTNILSSNGHRFISVKASSALSSIATVKVGALGSASSDAGSAGWTLNAPGGLTTNQYGWAQRTTL